MSEEHQHQYEAIYFGPITTVDWCIGCGALRRAGKTRIPADLKQARDRIEALEQENERLRSTVLAVSIGHLDRLISSLLSTVARGLATAVRDMSRPTEHDYFPRDYVTVTIPQGRTAALDVALAAYDAWVKEHGGE